jgi:hypothetical protein
MDKSSLISRLIVIAIPLRIIFLFFILFLIVLLNFWKYKTKAASPRFWATIFYTYLIPVSIVTVVILLPLDFAWVLFTGYEFPLNYFTFLRSPLLLRFVKVLFDAIFSFLFTDFIMRAVHNLFFVKPFIDEKLYQLFRRENKNSEVKKVLLFSAFLILFYLVRYFKK